MWGWSAEAKVDKQTVAFYRLTVSDVIAESGFLIHCRSNTKGKFKIAIFGSDGNIIHQSESMRSYDKSITYSSAFFTKFDTYQFKEDAVLTYSTTQLLNYSLMLSVKQSKATKH